MDLSVIVPTRNEAANIPHLLASIPRGVQLVVCDDSSDATPALVQQLRPDDTLVLRCGPTTIAEARQRGALASAGDILVFTDADVQFDSAYFDRLLARRDWDGICGAKLSPDTYVRDYQVMCSAQGLMYGWFGIAAASGSNMAVTRQAFAALGGFRLQLRCNEDTEFFLRGGRSGLRMRFDRRLIVWARDHRRLERGRLRKVMHSLVRNCLLYATCRQPRLPAFLEDDWGYFGPELGRRVV